MLDDTSIDEGTEKKIQTTPQVITSESFPQKDQNQAVDKKSKRSSDIPRTVTWKGVLLYGICVLLGNHFAYWTLGLDAGFWSYFGIMWAIGTSFGCEVLCVAEMTAALPFSGGTYGVVRVTLGDLAGYLIGTTETAQYILYVSITTISLGQYVTTMTEYDEKYEPLYWLIMYTTIIIVLGFHRTLFWKSMWLFGIYTTTIIVIYCTFTRENSNLERYIQDPEITNVSYNERIYQFFRALPKGSWFFNLAVKIMPLTCSETINPTVNVPKAIYYSYAIAIISAICILFCSASISPGVSILRKSMKPLSYGYSQIFNIPLHHALAFTMIARFGTCLCYAFAYSVQIAALSKSGFMWRTTTDSTLIPIEYNRLISILTGCLIGFLLNLMIWYWDKDFKMYLYNGYRTLAYFINIMIFITYIVFKNKFSTLVKTYKSPVGIYGAVYGIMMFIIVFISICSLSDEKDRWSSYVLLFGFLLVWSIPYFLYYRHHITYSEEESTIMFIAYVMRANQARRANRSSRSLASSPRGSVRSTQRKYSQRENHYHHHQSNAPALSPVVEDGPRGSSNGEGGHRGQARLAKYPKTQEVELELPTTKYADLCSSMIPAPHSTTTHRPVRTVSSEDTAERVAGMGGIRIMVQGNTRAHRSESDTTVSMPYMDKQPSPEAVEGNKRGGIEAHPSTEQLSPCTNQPHTARNAVDDHTPHSTGMDFYPEGSYLSSGDQHRVVPLTVRDTAEYRAQRIAMLESVLSQDLQYDHAVLEQMHNELEQYYHSESRSSHSSGGADGELDEEVGGHYYGDEDNDCNV